MASLLPKNEYKFKNLDKEEYNKGKVFYFYCDNLHEGIQILSWLEEYNKEMKLLKRGYDGISNYISIYEIDGKSFTIILCSYYHNGDLPRLVRQIINKIDKPDVVIYSKNEDKIICGIENTETCFAGNATWQRQGRIMNFLKNGFPFIFFAYYSKKDISQNQKRKASPLFVLSFFALSIENSTPAILSLYDHDDVEQNILKPDGSRMIDTRKESLAYILSLMRFGSNSDETREKLKQCFSDMKYYYTKEAGRIKEKELPAKTLELLRKESLEEEIIEKIEKKDIDYPIFFSESGDDKNLFNWTPESKREFLVDGEIVAIDKYLKNQLGDIKFYELSPNCPAGITFDTEGLVKKLSKIKDTGDYFWEDSLDCNAPTVIILIKFTKGKKLSPPDPCNGRIPAFYGLYKQSFKNVNCIIYLMDHSNANEYEVAKVKNNKIYKTINDYATIFVDRDLNVLDKNCDKAVKDKRSKYAEETTEDNVTCFFETILKMENIEPSFISPPCGSWSDFKLYPTDKFVYINRDADRPDIAYYISKNKEFNDGIYYVGESKATDSSFWDTDSFKLEVERINRLIQIIKKKINIPLEYKTFILFKGVLDVAKELVEEIRNGNKTFVDYVVVIEDNRKEDYDIKMHILEV